MTASEAPEASSDKGNPKTSDSIPVTAQPLPSSPNQFDDEIDDTQSISILMPESTQVLPAIPNSPTIDQIADIMEITSGLRQQKLDEIHELAQQYHAQQPPTQPSHQDSDSLNILEQHYNGEFEQAIQRSSPDSCLFNPNLHSDQAQPSTSIATTSEPNIEHTSSLPPTASEHSDELTSDTEPRFTMILNTEPPISLKQHKHTKPIQFPHLSQPHINASE
jgi:hypothetical protein